MGLGGLKEQKAFEKSIWEKVKRGGGESPAIIQVLSPHSTHTSLPLCFDLDSFSS